MITIKQSKTMVESYYGFVGAGLLAGSVFSFGLAYYVLPLLLLPIIHLCLKDTSLRSYLYKLSLFFISSHGIVLIWFLDADISGVSDLSDGMILFVSILSWVVMSIVLTLAILIPFSLLYKLRKPQKSVGSTLIFLPATFVVGEWTRSWVFSIFLYGNEGLLGDNWNFGSLGLAAMLTPLGRLSSLVGLYGLTFITVVIAICIYLFIFRKHFKPFFTVVIMIVAGLLISIAFTNRGEEKKLEASILGLAGNLNRFTLESPVEPRLDTKKDLIILPEYSDVFTDGNEHVAQEYVNERLADDGVSIDVDEGPQDKWHGTIQIRDNNGTIVDSNTKELLIPTGEYLPYILQWYFMLTGQDHILGTFAQDRQLYRGNPPQVVSTASTTIGPIACSGILSREAYRTLAQQGAEVLTNSASLTIFNKSQAYFGQSLMMAKFHAVANNRPFLQATRAAAPFALAANGEYILEPEGFQSRFSDVEVTARTNRTLYTVVGEWVLVASLLAVFGCSAYSFYARKMRYTKKRREG